MVQYITLLYIITYCIHTYMYCYVAYTYVVIGAEYVHMPIVCLCTYRVGGGGWESVLMCAHTYVSASIHVSCTWFVAVADSDLSLANPICPIQMYMINSIRSCCSMEEATQCNSIYKANLCTHV